MGGRFVKGVSGNPLGRPKSGEAITEIFREFLDGQDDGDLVTRKQRLVEELYRRAVGTVVTDEDGNSTRTPGSDDILKYIINRLDGMPRQAVDLDATMHSDDTLTVFIGRRPDETSIPATILTAGEIVEAENPPEEPPGA